MRTRQLPLQKTTLPSLLASGAVLLLLGAAAVDAQRSAVPRSGGGGGGRGGGGSVSSSGGGGRAVSGGSHRSTGRHSAGPRARRGQSSGPHRPTGTYRRNRGRNDGGRYYGGHHGGHYGGYYGGHYGYGYGYSSLYFGLGYGYPYYYGYGGYPLYYRPYGGYYPYPAVAVGDAGQAYTKADLGAVSLKVRPKNAEVYVDGSYVGAAKGFDGSPRYLWLPPGHYELTLYYPGYTNIETSFEITPGEVLKYSLELHKGGEGVRPEPPEPRRPYQRRGDYGAPADVPPSSPHPPSVSRSPIDEDLRREPGGLVLDIHPADASVYLDGRFIGTGREVSTLRSSLLVDPGTHTLQVIHPDYRSQDIEFEIGTGAERELKVMLIE